MEQINIKDIKDIISSPKECCICHSKEGIIKRCFCKKCYCLKCFEEGEEIQCLQTCYLFNNNLNYTNQVYNISKYPLPKNCEVKVHFNYVGWVRIGITFNKEIINDQNDVNSPEYDIYYILEDFTQFYTLNKGWKNCFKSPNILRAGDNVTFTLKNGELRYSINDIQLNGFIKIDLSNKEEMYLLVHARNDRSKCQIIYIAEI